MFTISANLSSQFCVRFKKKEKKIIGHSETFVFISQCMFIVLLQGLHIYINVDVFINIFIYIYIIYSIYPFKVVALCN